MSNSPISINQFNSLVLPLAGMVVSFPWKATRSTIFLELGELAPPLGTQRHRTGDAYIAIYLDWRVEDEKRVCFGSSNTGPEIEDGLNALIGVKVDTISTVGKICELVIPFSNGQRLKSMTMLTGDPAWCIRLRDGSRIFAEGGILYTQEGKDKNYRMPKWAAAAFELAETTALRWGTPSVESRLGNCRDCRSYVRINGDGCLLDFGVCADAASPFDGRVVQRDSGCPVFVSR